MVAQVNERPILVGDLVDGGRTQPYEDEGHRGVVVGHRYRDGRVACSGPGPYEDENAVQGVVLMRPGEDPRFLRGVQNRIRELNATAGMLLPGVRIEPYYTGGDGGTEAMWVYGLFSLNASPQAVAERARTVARLLREFPEVERVVSQVGTSEDGDFQSTNQSANLRRPEGGSGPSRRPKPRPSAVPGGTARRVQP